MQFLYHSIRLGKGSMGNDGGTIAKGQDRNAVFGTLTANGPLKLENHKDILLSTCALSGLLLYQNGKGQRVVSDFKGRLYLKEKILEFLLGSRENSGAAHIRSLKDVIELKITWTDDGRIECPLTGPDASRWAYLRTCGCLMSHAVLEQLRDVIGVEADEIMGKKDRCPVCDGAFQFNVDVVILVPAQDEKEELGKTSWAAVFNLRNYDYLERELQMSHSKQEKKKKSRKRKGEDSKAGNKKKREASTGSSSQPVS